MQTEILLFMQQAATPFLDAIAELVTMLGEESLMMLVVGWIYWNRSKERGFRLALILIFSGLLNSWLKLFFRTERPYLALDGVSGKRLETAGGYSFPSGHTQTAATFYFSLAALFAAPRRRFRWFTAALLISSAVAVSRIYLGVHWPVDVVAGLLLGALCSLPLLYGFRWIETAAFVLAAPLVIATLIFAWWNMSSGAALIGVENSVKAAALWAGLVYGVAAERRFLGFDCSGPFVRRLLRFLIGVSAAFLLRGGLKLLLPPGALADTLRYLLVGGWFAFLFPWIGSRTELFKR